MSKILVLSGSRADFAYLRPVAEEMAKQGADVKIESLANVIGGEDTPQAIASRAGAILCAGGRTLAENRPDLMLVLGDRWEIASACIAAVLAGIPVAHLGSGEVTKGSYDNSFRRMIEGAATIKFAFTDFAMSRLAGGHCILAGCTSVTRPATPHPGDGTAIICLYPETAGEHQVPPEFIETIIGLVKAEGLEPLVIRANPDVGSNRYTGGSLPHEEFHERLYRASVIVGNSSAGIIEAPILGTPTVDIGYRQRGRRRAESIFRSLACKPTPVKKALRAALGFGKRLVDSPYYHPYAARAVADACIQLCSASQKPE